MIANYIRDLNSAQDMKNLHSTFRGQSKTLPFVLLWGILFASCKKNKEVNLSDLRLTSVEWTTNGQASRLIFDYDANGRISQVKSVEGNGNPTNVYTIQYSANLISISSPSVNGTSTTITDTIYLQMEGNNRVMRRIHVTFFEVKLPEIPQRTYTRDSTTYDYDAAGLLAKETKGYWDSTWFNPGAVQTVITRRTGVINHTISNGDVMLVHGLINFTATTRTTTNTYTTVRTEETSDTYEYSKSYRNKMDFSNAAVLNEFASQSGLPLNANYAHLPDKVTNSNIDKDQNGNVISNNTSTNLTTFTYNVYGWVESREDFKNPEGKVTFKYTVPNH